MAQIEIQALTEPELGELGEFLAEGFHAPAGSAFCAGDVLRWKYLDPRGDDSGDAPRSYLARDRETQRIVGHLGVCPGRFRGGGLPPEGLSTHHMIDWLTSEAGKGSGGLLMRRARRGYETQYGLGGSAASRAMGVGSGYQLVGAVPVFHRVLRPFHRLRDRSRGPAGRALRAAKDIAGRFARPSRTPRTPIEIRRIDKFETDIIPILRGYESRAIFTTREPDLLNHILRYPRGGISGWHLWREGVLRGFALLAVVPGEGGVRVGKIADCVLDDTDVGDDAWHAAFVALTAELNAQKADLAVAFSANSWTENALMCSGFGKVHHLEFRLRDRGKMIPPGATFHLTPLEADYALT